MKISFKQSLIAIALPMVLVASPVMAASEGQIEGGQISAIKNLTSGADFANPASATGCQTLLYSVRIHNPGPGTLSNVNVKVNVPAGVAISNTATYTLSSVNASPSTTTATSTVNFNTPLALTYVPGTTQLLDANKNVIATLPDGILAGGVNIGTQNVSLLNIRYVRFQEKTTCTTPTPTTPVLPDTGSTGGVAGLLGLSAIVGSALYFRRSRQAIAETLRNR